mmetsp:Transcript_2115/g.4861  ORF Transcript_2115/g.4861 Transcript_2115/m.4861 type:complete len:404 (-) Transcript_2115:751-1962(-)
MGNLVGKEDELGLDDKARPRLDLQTHYEPGLRTPGDPAAPAFHGSTPSASASSANNTINSASNSANIRNVNNNPNTNVNSNVSGGSGNGVRTGAPMAKQSSPARGRSGRGVGSDVNMYDKSESGAGVNRGVTTQGEEQQQVEEGQQEQQQGADHDPRMTPVANAGTNAGGAEISEEEVDEMLEDLERDDKVPMVFRWDGGGRNVYITGTFNRWTEKIPMRRSGNDFLYIRELKRGKHAYKFIVDDEWRFAPDQPTVADPHGYINNFVDLTDFKETYGADMKSLQNKDHITDDSLYGNFRPDPEDPQWYAKEPPPLPPHLRHIILNTPQTDDTIAAKSMQIPQHVTLNHLYCSAIKENLMVLGVTQRYQSKFVTTVFYSPLPDAKIVGRTAVAAGKSRPTGQAN